MQKLPQLTESRMFVHTLLTAAFGRGAIEKHLPEKGEKIMLFSLYYDKQEGKHFDLLMKRRKDNTQLQQIFAPAHKINATTRSYG